MVSRRFSQRRALYGTSLLAVDFVVVAGLYSFLVTARALTGGVQEEIDFGIISLIYLATIVPLAMVGGYQRLQPMTSPRFLSEHAVASVFSLLFGFVLIYGITTLGRVNLTARGNVGATLLLFPPLSITYRALASRRVQRNLAAQCLFVAGGGAMARDFRKLLRRFHWAGQVRFFALRPEQAGTRLDPGDAGSPLLESGIEAAVRASERQLAGVVLAAEPHELGAEQQRELLRLHFRHTVVQTYEHFCAEYWKFVPASELSLWWAIDDGFRLNHNPTFERFKRLSDVLVAGLALLLLAPVLLLTAIAVRIDSRGKCIFRQTRVGLNEQPFTLYKFRSMQLGGETGPRYTQPGDQRITRLGRFLRKTRLDELPQLWNVLRGDMSLIGPRAEWIELVRGYEAQIPHYHFRHMVKPGITGWAQVNYPYGGNLEDTVEKLKYDLYYIRHYSFRLDLTIVLKTIYTMLGGLGR
jgi:exopolysaccharide biosynthesis polyprenyl glycosylphosphotransferase